MARDKAQFAALDKLGNLAARFYADGGKRKVGDAKDDEIGDGLSKAADPSDVAAMAFDYGVPADRLKELAKKAPNFGQFRMTVGNLMRGVLSRKAAADKAGVKMTWEQVGTVDAYKARLREVREANKPAKSVKQPKAVPPQKAPAKSAAKAGKAPAKVGRQTKRAVGLDGVARTVTHEGDGDATEAPRRGGAPTKADAAKRGRGRKSKAAAAVAGGNSDVAAAGDVEGQTTLADVLG